jgi:hypothetical protein
MAPSYIAQKRVQIYGPFFNNANFFRKKVASEAQFALLATEIIR